MTKELEKELKQLEQRQKEIKEQLKSTKKRTTIYITEEDLKDLKQEALDKDTSVTDILEKLITNHLKSYKASKNKSK